MRWPDDFINKVICGDCRDILPLIPDGAVDLVVTDPPYGFNRFSTDSKDFLDEIEPALLELPRVLRPGGFAFIFSGTGEVLNLGNIVPLDFQRMLWVYKPSDCTYPWRGWLLKSEAILCFSNGDPSQLEDRRPYRHDCYIHTKVGQEGIDGHPTVKPLSIIEDLCLRVFNNAVILDPFLGSGTTSVAAKNLGRRFIGIEVEPKYCEIAERRLRQEVLFPAGIEASE